MQRARKFKDYMKKSFTLYTAVLIVLMFVCFIAIMLFNYKFFTMKTNEDCNAVVRDFVAEQYRWYDQRLLSLAGAAEVKEALTRRENFDEVNRMFYEVCLRQRIRANFILLDAAGEILTTNLYQTNRVLFSANHAAQDMIHSLKVSSDLAYRAAWLMAYDNGQASNLRFAQVVRSWQNEILGYVVFDLQEAGLRDFLRDKDADIILLTDRFDNVIFTTNTLLVDTMGKYRAAADTVTMDKKEYYVTAAPVPGQNLKIITMVQTSRQRQMLWISLLFLCGISVFMVAAVHLIARRVAAHNARFIDELFHAVSECKRGNIAYRIASRTFDEFQPLYFEFNEMMTRLQEVMQHNGELAERKRQMEVKHLEGQFNPHFVFNILETLRYQMLLEPQKAEQMILSFANLMRYSINYGNTHVVLQTDIAYVEDYLALQKIRYSQRLQYHIVIEEVLLAAVVPKLLIQPMIENSIVHGLENTKDLVIEVTGRAEGKDFTLRIADNGQGMTSAQLNQL